MSRNTQLEHAFYWEKEKPDSLWLTQPMGGGKVKELTWKQALDQARRMATYLRFLAFPEKSHIAIFSKNSAWWLLSDLAIWMEGHVSISALSQSDVRDDRSDPRAQRDQADIHWQARRVRNHGAGDSRRYPADYTPSVAEDRRPEVG